MSSGLGFVVGLLAVAAVVVVMLAVDSSRPRQATRRPAVEAARPVAAPRPVVQPVPLERVEILTPNSRPAPDSLHAAEEVESVTPEDDAAVRRMAAVRRARERLTKISVRVQEAIITEALRRAGTQVPDDGYVYPAAESDEPEG